MITFIQAILDTIRDAPRTGRNDVWRERFHIHHPMRVREVPRSSGAHDVFIVWGTANDKWGVFSLEKKELILAMNNYSGIGFETIAQDQDNPKYLAVSYDERRKDQHFKKDLFSLSEKRLMGFEAMSPTYSWEGFWSVCVGDKWGMFSIKDDKLVVPIEYKDVGMAPHEKDWKKRRLVLVTNTDDRKGLYSLDNQSVVRWWDWG